MIVPPFPDDVVALRERLAAFLVDVVHPLEDRIAQRGSIEPRELDDLRAQARAEGFAMLNMPREVGGADLSMLGQVALEEEAGKATNGLGFIAYDRGPREFCEIATPDQVQRYVLPVVRGEAREAWAVTEPGAGSDVGGITTTARRDGGDWVLDGEKWFVTAGDEADYWLVLARVGDEQSLFVVERDNPGAEIVGVPGFMHDPYIDRHVELRLTGARVPDRARVPGGGGEGSRRWFQVERLFIAARCCGAAERLLALARAHALEREAFGKPIGEYQAVQFMLADSLTELAAARLLTYHAAHAFDTDPDPKVAHGKVAMAKLFASEMAGRVADRAVQVLGGRGYQTRSPAERYYRELRVERIWEGTSEIQRWIIGRALLKHGIQPYLTEDARARAAVS